MRTESEQRQWVTAVIDAWPYTLDEIEHAVYSALNIAQKVTIVVPDLLAPYGPEDFSELPGEVLRLPFWGTFTTMRNQALARVNTPWALLLHGNEEFQARDAGRLLSALEPESPGIYRLIVATGAAGQILAEPVRLVPVMPQIRFSGRIWPQITGSLIEYGFPIRSLQAHVYRLENRVSTLEATRRLRAELVRLEEFEPRQWRANLALAVLSWAEHRYQEVVQRLARVPRGASIDGIRIAGGIGVLASLEQGQPEAALRQSRKLLERHPDWAELWSLTGQAEMALQRWDRAMIAFAQALTLREVDLPHMEPGYATSKARLRYAEAELAEGRLRTGLARLMNLIEDYPGYRAAWQTVLAHLRGANVEEVFSTMATVIAPSKIRQFFSLLNKPSDDERPLKEWLETRQFPY
ncbi:hypothetical protein HIJ39_14430 [Sulfobacillus sp. DSM 109850]|uniref:Tetratricopeptide repeat protein n=1 Tax=Sulfobacillus harzensis TaxID=2729629 RepID=A0A7Y0Q3M3_9FIRM|nr:hypothetical protein [Sulfobacillus harzensis]